MGLLDRLKVMLGVLDEDDLDDGGPRRGERPSLDGIAAAPQEALDDALAAREAGDLERMRQLLRDMDRGRGLRRVLRAAAALEAGDEGELAELLPSVRGEQPAWKLPLQVAATLEDRERARTFLSQAERGGAPAWARAWVRALSPDGLERRAGLVELLFRDAELARTVAARDLGVPEAEAQADALQRYASFAHGRECIRRFGPAAVAALLDRAEEPR